jgi:hypothetical protein
MLALRCAALFSALAISITLHFLKGRTNEVLKEHQNNKASDNYPFCTDWPEKPTELVIRGTQKRHEKSNSEAQALLIEGKRGPHPQTEIPEETLRRIWHLTMRLSDAGLRRRQTKLIYPHHRFPSWLTEDATRDRSNRLLECPVARRKCVTNDSPAQIERAAEKTEEYYPDTQWRGNAD